MAKVLEKTPSLCNNAVNNTVESIPCLCCMNECAGRYHSSIKKGAQCLSRHAESVCYGSS